MGAYASNFSTWEAESKAILGFIHDGSPKKPAEGLERWLSV